MLKEILGRENIMLFVFGDHGMTSTGMLICIYQIHDFKRLLILIQEQ